MYSSKENVNILTSLLVAHGIRHVVVCPGSRNAPLVHNFNECPELRCYPVTDERSAGFFALGIAQATDTSVAVCVTSGTALLNVAPAVAEASYQHRGLLVISADRPQAWIDQLDGQTLPQQNAFGVFVGKCVNLPEVIDDESHWHCNRLVNEALLALKDSGGKSVHVNVPISEPLFEFPAPQLPAERKITMDIPDANVSTQNLQFIISSKRPIIVLGLLKHGERLKEIVDRLKERYVVLHEPLAVGGGSTWFDKMFDDVLGNDLYAPDSILYIGDTVVSKLLKRYLRSLSCTNVCMVNESGIVEDVTMHANSVLKCSAEDALAVLSECESCNVDEEFHARWNGIIQKWRSQILPISSKNILKETVRLFEQELEKRTGTFHVHYANSTSVRYGCLYATHYIYVNRGVNGIEGSLSTAAGYSVAAEEKTIIVTGDLSFFYDANALWNQNLNGNLRIILLNNGCGGIFSKLKGLENSPARDEYVAARHHSTAEGLCKSYRVEYLSASTMDEVKALIASVLDKESSIPMLLEVRSE